jgi:phosphoribosyl 1,2-cyclic phosphodiesterase
MITVRPIASSSAGNATLLEADGSRLLLDAGLPWARLRAAMRHRVSDLSAALITHEHGDHARAVPDLLKASVDVYATPGTWDALEVQHHRAHRLDPLTRATLPGGWRVVALPVQHDARQPCAFVIGGHGAKVLYLTDAPRLAYQVNGLTHVLLEANWCPDLVAAAVASGRTPAVQAERLRRTHLSLPAAVRLLQATDLRRVESITLLHLSDGHSDARRFADTIRAATGCPVTVAPRDAGGTA